jgi:RsiW-degrading membrane proteinase PrsW (M82 family)
MAADPLRRATWLLAIVATIGPLAWFVRVLADVPAAIVVSAAVPALVYAWCLGRIDRADDGRASRLALVAALGAGAVVAGWLAHTANAWVLAWAGQRTTTDEARLLAGGFAAPAIEEVAKAAVLAVLVLARRDRRAGPLDGIVHGGLVGVGFAFTENVVYLTFAMLQGGQAGWLRGVYLRALLGGWNHAAFTATTGAALGWALRDDRTAGPRWLVVAVGLGLAIVQHVAWNAVAATAINGVLCGPELGAAPCRADPTWTSLFVLVPILMAIFVGPGVLTLAAIAVMARRPSLAEK